MRIPHSTFHIPYSDRKGFTMVEFIVSVGLFSVIVAMAIGGFIQALRTQRQTGALIATNSSLSLVVEQMTREMRTGSDFCNGLPNAGCPIGDLWSNGRVVFTNSAGKTVVYCLNSTTGAIERGEAVSTANCGDSGFHRITPNRAQIQHMAFYLSGNKVADGKPTQITIVIGASPRELGVSESYTNMQTTVTIRNIDS